MSVFASKETHHPMIFAHRHGDARAEPGHRTNGRDTTEADDRGDDAPAALTENMFAGNQTDFELAGHFLLRRGQEKNRVDRGVNRDDEEGAKKEGARNI